MHFVRQDGQDGKNRKENQATKVTKILKIKRRKYGMNKKLDSKVERQRKGLGLVFIMDAAKSEIPSKIILTLALFRETYLSAQVVRLP